MQQSNKPNKPAQTSTTQTKHHQQLNQIINKTAKTQNKQKQHYYTTNKTIKSDVTAPNNKTEQSKYHKQPNTQSQIQQTAIHKNYKHT